RWDDRSQTVGAVCTARDLSELRKVEAVARERQGLLKNIMESAREAIYALDAEGRYKWCNQAMRRDRFARALHGEAQSFESRYVARDGTVRYASVNAAPIIVDGQTTGVL